MRMVENGMVDYTEPRRKTHCCPVCGEPCEKLYKDKWGEIFACDECVEEVDAWEEDDE